MSENPKYYKQLKENPEFIPVISKQEKEINSRQYYYIPEDEIKKSEGKINLKKNGLLNVKQKQPGEDTIQLNEIFELLKKEEKKEKEDCKDEKKVIKVINESKVEEIDTKEKEELKELGKFIKKIVSEEKNNKKDVNNGSLNNDSDDDEEGFVDIDVADL